MSIVKNFSRPLVCLVLAGMIAGLTACSGGSLFGENEEEQSLPGERYTILELEEELEPDPALQVSQISLPRAWDNRYWPQMGGYPNHAMGHLALGPDLKQVFNIDIGEGASGEKPLFMPPVIVENLVFTLDNNLKVSAFDSGNGKRRWDVVLPVDKNARSSAMGGGVAYGEGKLFVTTGLRTVFVLNPQNGDIVHTITLPVPSRAAPSILDGRLYVQMMDNSISVYDTTAFKPAWSHQGFNETTSLLGAAAPAVDKDIIVSAFSTGEILALRNLNGQTLWSDNLASVRPASALASIADIKGAVVLDKGLAYAISYNGRMVAIDIPSGRRVWQREIGGTQTPWAVGNVVYVVTNDRELVALSRVDGRIYWVEKLPRGKDAADNIWYGPVMGGGRLITVNAGGDVREHDPVSGRLVKSWEMKGAPASAPVISGGRMYVVLQNGALAAYQ